MVNEQHKGSLSGFLDKFTIKARVSMMTISTVLIFLICSTTNNIMQMSDSMYLQKEKQIEYVTEVAYNLINSYYQKVLSGEYTEEEAKFRAQRAVRQLRYDGKNYIWINDYQGTMIMHPAKPEMEGHDLNAVKDVKGKLVFVEAIKVAKEQGKGKFEYYWSKPGDPNPQKGYPKFSYVRGFKEWGWVIATGVYVDDVQKEISHVVLQSIIINVILMIMIIILMDKTIGKSIISPIQGITKLSFKLADNDFTVNIPDDENKTEIGELNRSFKKFTSNLRSLIGRLRSEIEEVATSSQQVSQAAEETALGSQQVASSVGQLASGAQEQADSSNDALDNINRMNKIIQSIAEEVDGASKETQVATNQANEGSQQASEAKGKINEIKDFSLGISKDIDDLGKLSSEIEVIVDLIKNIASQTNLLALNAAIEAARAGEHGKGFAVVADEVKKLATQSADATDKITAMIKEIQVKTGDTVLAVESGVKTVEEGVSLVDTVESTLKTLANISNTNKKLMEKTVDNMKQLSKNSDNVVNMMENISAITDESAASASEIASITEEQTASLEQINASSQTLAKIATELQTMITIFKV